MQRRGDLRIKLKNDLAEIARVGPFVESFCAKHGLTERHAHHLTLVLEELATNVLSYGFEDGAPGHDVTMVLALRGEDIDVLYEDSGRAFDIMSAPVPDLEGDVDSRGIGGLGIHLVKHLMDRVDYARTGNRNRIHMTIKMLDEVAGANTGD